MERLHITVYGKVQGVGFRYHTQQQATQLELTGYVKNLPDGCVEIVAEGSAEALSQFQVWVSQGPPAAQVRQLTVSLQSATEEFDSFSIEG